MRIEHIQVQNFLRLRLVDLDLSSQIATIIAGDNESGKSSTIEAVRFALLGDVLRVSRKSDYKAMVTDGAKDGMVAVTVEGETHRREVKSGKLVEGQEPDIPALPFVLDAQRFASAKPQDRRPFLLGLTGTSVNRENIAKRLTAKGINNKRIEAILPLLRSGFEAAEKDARQRATQEKAKWEAITNERWGSDKGADWKPAAPDASDIQEPDEIRAMIMKADEEIDRLTELRGNLNAEISAIRQRQTGPAPTPLTCPCCAAMLREATVPLKDQLGHEKVLVPYEQPKKVQDEDAENERAGKMMGQLMEVSGKADAEKAKRAALLTQLADAIAHEAFTTKAEETALTAKAIHEDIMGWIATYEALGANGIPAEILADALKPVNDRLRHTALQTGWAQVRIEPDMEITVDGRPFGLQSESAQWRASAAIADAISHLSGLRLLLLDRFDVLSLPNRDKLLRWLSAVKGDYDTIILCGTLKAPPQKLPAGFAAVWLENGEIQPATDAAA